MSKIKRVLFLGSKSLGLRVLQEMHLLSPETLMGAITIDDSEDSRTELSRFQTFAKSAPIDLQVVRNGKQAAKIIFEKKPDLCMVVGWYWFLSDEVLEGIPHGCLGIHNSLLPKYRGGSPLLWPILNGENEVGFSIFSLSTGMDEGPIWAQGRVPVEEQDYISDVLGKIEIRIIEVFRDLYVRILDGAVSPVEQDHAQATYCAQRFPMDGNVDWQKPANEIYNFIRAQSNPYPGAFTFMDHKKLTLWKARKFDSIYYGTPGQVANINKHGVSVICGDNRAIVLEEVEMDGLRVKANTLLKSIRTRFACQ